MSIDEWRGRSYLGRGTAISAPEERNQVPKREELTVSFKEQRDREESEREVSFTQH